MRMRRRLCIYINRSVVQAGKLEVKMGELKQEVVEANVNRLQKELQMGTDCWQQGNLWQVGVPYGSKCGRALVGGEKDRFGRQVAEREGVGSTGGQRAPLLIIWCRVWCPTWRLTASGCWWSWTGWPG